MFKNTRVSLLLSTGQEGGPGAPLESIRVVQEYMHSVTKLKSQPVLVN